VRHERDNFGKVQDTAALKGRAPPNIPANFVKQWRFQNFASVQEALDFVNLAPAQVAGEISGIARNDGTVGMFYFL
jgi:hypothetical protein